MPVEPGVTPEISVIIPTHNRRTMVRSAVESALSQDFSDIEVLVIDDGSTDGTLDELRSITDERVRLLSNIRGRGPAGARNAGLLAARGELIAFLDSDDIYLPGHLSASASLLAREPTIGLVFGRARYQENGKIIPYMDPNLIRKLGLIANPREEAHYTAFDHSLFDDLLDLGCFFNLCSVVFRRAVVDSGELMDERLRLGEDYEYWLRLSARVRFAFLKAEQVVTCLHSTNLSYTNSREGLDRIAQEEVTLCRMVRGLPGLTPVSLRKANRNLAKALFELGYLNRTEGRHRDARAHYRNSMRTRFSWVALRAYLKSFLL